MDKPPFNNVFWVKGEFREHTFNNSQGIFIGFMHLRLEKFLVDQERKMLFDEILVEAKNFFSNMGDLVSVEDLNAFQLVKETKRTWLEPLETKRVIKILDYLELVVNDNLKNKGEINYGF
jgi:uncharacterized protein YutD